MLLGTCLYVTFRYFEILLNRYSGIYRELYLGLGTLYCNISIYSRNPPQFKINVIFNDTKVD